MPDSKNAFRSLTVVIPSRNRPELVQNAIRSVLSQVGDELRIVVSDNSTDSSALEQVAAFCREINDPRLTYIKPAQPLSMSQHFAWAFGEILKDDSASHYTMLSDRMVFKAGGLANVLSVVRHHPTKIVSYSHDRIDDRVQPVRLEENLWSGNVIELNAAYQLQLSSRCVFHPSLPRIMNCVAPRFVFMDIQARFGHLFESIAPDFNFCYRALDLYETFIYYDATPLIHYALQRSNGESQATGVVSKDHLDFAANLGGRKFNFATPVPEFLTLGNAIVHEYCYHQQQSQSHKLPPLDQETYFQHIGREIESLQNPELKAEMSALFVRIRGEQSLEAVGARTVTHRYPWFLRAAKRLVLRLLRTLTQGGRARWLLRFVEPYSPPQVVSTFPDAAAAIAHAGQFPRSQQSTSSHLNVLRTRAQATVS